MQLRLISNTHLRNGAFAFAIPFALLASACSGDSETTPEGAVDAGKTGDAAAVGDGGRPGDGSVTDPLDDGSAAVDTLPPTVDATSPTSGAVGVGAATTITARFSEAMTDATLTPASFTLKRGATAVEGAVSYFDGIATFNPTSDLALGASYTATITTDAQDAAGNALGAAYSWTFTTTATAPLGPAPVFLGAAGRFALLAKSKISNVPTSKITGDIALSPAAASYITGFALKRAGTRWTSPEVVGSIYAADNDPPTPKSLTIAVGAMETAYTNAAGRPTPTSLNLAGGTLAGVVLTPGLYRWTSTVTIPGDISLSGGPNDVFIFQITGDLKMSASKSMTLVGGAQAKNVFWQVAGFVDFASASHAEGVVLSHTAITLGTGASVHGRLFAQTAITIAGSTVVAPAL